MRLIDADELIEHIWRDRLDSRERIANLVESMPTIKGTIPVVDVVPVVHAHWKDNKNGTVSCSRCSTWFQKGRVPYLRFCGYCGAKMDGGEST